MPSRLGANSIVVTPAITVSLGAYGANDVVGGILELERAFATRGGTAILQTVFVTDDADQDGVFEILLFNALPEQTYTDNAAVPTLDADIAKLVARVSVAAGDYVTVGGLATATAADLGRVIQAAQGATSLWCVIVVTSTPTYLAADDLSVAFALLQE